MKEALAAKVIGDKIQLGGLDVRAAAEEALALTRAEAALTIMMMITPTPLHHHQDLHLALTTLAADRQVAEAQAPLTLTSHRQRTLWVGVTRALILQVTQAIRVTLPLHQAAW